MILRQLFSHLLGRFEGKISGLGSQWNPLYTGSISDALVETSVLGGILLDDLAHLFGVGDISNDPELRSSGDLPPLG